MPQAFCLLLANLMRARNEDILSAEIFGDFEENAMLFRRSIILVAAIVWMVSDPYVRAAAPSTSGPYLVGVRREIFVDSNRTCAITRKKRTLITEIWYPAAPAARSLPVNRFEQFWPGPTGTLLARVAIGAFGGNYIEVNKHFKNQARRNAPIAEGAFPLLVFSHGNGGFRFQNTFQVEYLAAHGYIVAACDHTGNAAVTLLPDGPVIYHRETIKDVRRWDDRPRDLAFLVSRLEKENRRKDSWLYGKIKVGCYGALGHSFGGFTVARLAELDPRIKAILPMTLAGTLYDVRDLAGTGDEQMRQAASQARNIPCKIPLMVMLGDHDRTVHGEGNRRSRNYFARATGPRYLLMFKDAGHFTFTDMPQINPNFGDGVGIEKGKDGAPDFKYADASQLHRIINRYSVAFFDAYLKHDRAARQFLATNHYRRAMTYVIKDVRHRK